MLLEPQALLSGVKNGNRLMFTLCYDRYHRGIYLFVLKYVRCEALAEDIVQETFVRGMEHGSQLDMQEVFFRLWCNRRGLREEGNLAALLYAMAKNLTVNAIRKHKIVETGNVRYYDLHEGRQEPAGESDSDETMRRLRLAVGELPARQRTIFNLKIYESRSNQEIADMLNVSVNTVKVHYARTMKHLCQRLKKN